MEDDRWFHRAALLLKTSFAVFKAFLGIVKKGLYFMSAQAATSLGYECGESRAHLKRG